ncbi:MAG: FtsX-like permease family protein [Clostridiales Family XIII bacterium]|jgi:putative ABC transport system permease protein|nr:FtsX-like permease family protein [Clostridiales Family XIII bacterium]
MKNVLPITLANLRRGKSQAFSLFAFVLIAALLLNVGLLLMIDFSDFFDKRSEALHAPHYALIEEKSLYAQDQVDYIKDYPGVTEVEKENILNIFTNISYNGGKMLVNLFFLNTDTPRNMNDLSLIEGEKPETDDEICLPYTFKVGGGYEMGDVFSITVLGSSYSYKISGFTEEILFGSANNQMYQLYLSDSGFRRLFEQVPESESVILRARLENPEESENLRIDCTKAFFFQTDLPGADSLLVNSLDWSGVKLMRTMMSSITAIVLVLFAAVIVLVCLLVIRFRIRNTIEESMTNIGALKAMGYTSRQLLWATILQFGSITAVGILMGIGLSYTILPAVSDVLEEQTALQWQQGLDPLVCLITLATILLAVLVVTGLSAGRIRKLPPLTALRQGLSTHSFKRNHFSLDQTRGPLSLLLALKSTLQSKGQMFMIFIIVTAVSFAAVAGISISYNLGAHPDHFGRLLAGEMPDAAFFVKSPDDTQEVRDAIEKSGKARKLFYYQNFTVMIDDMQTTNIAAEDFSLFEGVLLYEGRYPKHDNEICLGGKLAERKNLDIGDSVKVSQGGKTAEYLIVGMIQTVNYGGMACAMTIDGVHRIQSDYRPREIYVYLEDNSKSADFVKSIERSFEEELESSINLKELMDAQLGMYGAIFRVLAAAIVAVTALVICMVLYLMLKTVILRRRRELGIQKALGFTTLQLMNQFALYFLPVITLGVAMGGIAGILGFNSLFVALTRYLGIMTASMPAPVGQTILMCGLLVILAYAFSLLISWRIRKVSAYALVTE